MNDRERYENGLLTLRFTGEQITDRGVSIYDLGETLLAIQRIVHKAYLAREGRLIKGAFPTKDERPELALQLGERRRTSDAFALVPIIADQAVRDSISAVVQYVITALVGYYTGDLLSRVRAERNHDTQIFIGSIYTEVANINNRIGTSGGLEAISVGSPYLGQETVAAFDSRTKDYLVELRGETYLGKHQEIKGSVYKLYPASKIVAIRRAGGSTVSIFLDEDDFDLIRYNQDINPIFVFKGRPIYKFGIETKSISEFEADEVELVGDDD